MIARNYDYKNITSFDDIPLLLGATSYGHMDVTTWWWANIDSWYTGDKDHTIILNPDYQRGHVWGEEQQIAFVEYCLRGGRNASRVIFNLKDVLGPYECVDGLQRLTAVHKFMHDELVVFDKFTCSMLTASQANRKKFPWSQYNLEIAVLSLQTRTDLLRFYLELNTGGTPHSASEIKRVTALLAKEQA